MRQEQQSFLEKWSSPASLCLTQFLVAYNVSVVPAIMPRIVRDLDSSVGSIQGALVLLPLVKASFAPTCENLIKRFSRKSVFMAGLGLFTIGAIATSVSSNMGFFLERVIQTYSREERKEFINNLPTVIQPYLDPILNTSAVEAMRTAVLLGLVFSLACLFLAFFLPKQSSRRTD
ncbi:MFS transporter [Fischerella sp.]|jgi:MFS family permease|uniref:MFS transporter n=1 Tax=Fischerella sp. TaxID=1191 RepID=UPI0025BC7926|nr:MFS transporter [Fischerella sp.]